LNSASYDMVAFQEQPHDGRTADIEVERYDVNIITWAFGG